MGGSSVTGLSGLSEIMQNEEPNRSALPAPGADPTPLPEARVVAAPADGTPPPAATTRPISPRTRRNVLLAIGILALVVAVAGLLVSLVAGGGDETTRTIDEPGAAESRAAALSADGDGSADDDDPSDPSPR
jgi:hypothetical protein